MLGFRAQLESYSLGQFFRDRILYVPGLVLDFTVDYSFTRLFGSRISELKWEIGFSLQGERPTFFDVLFVVGIG